MLRFDKDPEGGTAADISGRQSPFVSSGEETFRNVPEHQEDLNAKAEELLRRSEDELTDAERLFSEQVAVCAETARRGGKTAVAFGDRLPVGIFGVGNGENRLLPLGCLIEEIRLMQSTLCKVEVEWYRITESLSFGSLPEETLIAEQWENAELTERIRCRNRRRSDLLCAVDEAAEETERFLHGTVDAFFLRAEQAADLAHKGAEMQFSALRRLCGEFQNSANRYAAFCERCGKKYSKKPINC